MTSTDVVVIGCGAMGAAAAYELGRRGADAVVLEQFAIGHERGSSRGPTRIFRHAYPELDYVRLAQSALDAWRDLEHAAGEELLRLTGAIDIGPHTQACADALDAAGVAYGWLDAPEAAEQFEALSFDGVDRVLYHACAGVCRAGRTIEVLVRLARRLGVDVRESARVETIRTERGGVVVRLADEEIRARTAVVTTGAWSTPLLAQLGWSVPVVASSTHVAYFDGGRGPGDVPVVVERSAVDPLEYAYVVPSEEPGNAGVKVGQYWGDQVPLDPDLRTLEVDESIVGKHAAYVERRLVALDPEPVESESCLYEMTPTEDFIVDRRGDVVVGSGFSGHGFKFVPVIGRLLADLATDRLAAAPLPRFALERHRLP